MDCGPILGENLEKRNCCQENDIPANNEKTVTTRSCQTKSPTDMPFQALQVFIFQFLPRLSITHPITADLYMFPFRDVPDSWKHEQEEEHLQLIPHCDTASIIAMNMMLSGHAPLTLARYHHLNDMMGG